ncbi:MAG: methyltransferase [Brumimicrobium sp.]
MGSNLKGLDKDFWNSKYEENNIGWDMGSVSPPIKEYIDGIKDKGIKILIPGAGNAYEAKYLIEKGFQNITVVDISPNPVKRLKDKFVDNPSLTVIEADFFQHAGKYDLIIEQTFFCAIHPSLRPNYVKQMHNLLNQNGKLVGLLFEMENPDGPPFGGDRKEYQALFENLFDIKTMELCYNSHPARQGRELWIYLKKKKS